MIDNLSTAVVFLVYLSKIFVYYILLMTVKIKIIFNAFKIASVNWFSCLLAFFLFQLLHT